MGPQGRSWGEQLVKREARWSVRATDSFVTLTGCYNIQTIK